MHGLLQNRPYKVAVYVHGNSEDNEKVAVQKIFMELAKWCTRQTKWCAPLQKGLARTLVHTFILLLYMYTTFSLAIFVRL